MKRAFAILVASTAIAGVANAADVYAGGGSLKDTPIAVAVPTWTGFYIGVGAQGDSVTHDVKANEAYTDGNYSYSANAELNGLGAQGAGFVATVGADYQLGKVVLGAGFDYEVPSASTTLTLSDSNGNSFAANYDLTSFWSAWGRAGVLFTPSTLVYAKAGYGQATFHAGGELAKVLPSDQTYNGFVVGGGIETRIDALWSGATVRLEYTDFIGDSATLYTSKDGVLTVTNAPDIQSVKAILAFKFGGASDSLK